MLTNLQGLGSTWVDKVTNSRGVIHMCADNLVPFPGAATVPDLQPKPWSYDGRPIRIRQVHRLEDSS